MTERIRVVSSGLVGLDLALGGGIRLLRRTQLGDRESATILIRGGPGTGKSVLAQDMALRLAKEVNGDVLYVCIEVLPSEVLAQRTGFDGFDEARVLDLSRPRDRAPDSTGSHLLLGMRDPTTDEGVPDIGQELLDLARIAAERKFSPKVVVIDSLSDGYNLGTKAPRRLVDGVCKLAVEQGWCLILLEEVAEEAMSPWTFAVDTVLSLRLLTEGAPQARRQLVVTKHRFGSCEPGPHRLSIGRERVRVIPPLSAYGNAESTLALPRPSAARSLRVATTGVQPDWANFDVGDGVGEYVVVHATGLEEDEVEALTARIARTNARGEDSRGGFVGLALVELSACPYDPEEEGFRTGTLHQLIDGADWLENAVAHLVGWKGEITCVRVGPTNRLGIYANVEDLKMAISLFVDLLQRHGLVVILYGRDAFDLVRAGIVTGRWTATKSPGGAISVKAVTNMSEASVSFSPKLD